MISRTWNKTEIDNLRGAITWPEPDDVPENHAVEANNCEYRDGQVRTRYGFANAFNVNAATTAMYNWISGLGNYLVWFNAGTGIRYIDIAAASPSATTLHSTANGAGASFTNAGSRLYATIHTTAQAGQEQGVVIGYASSAFFADRLFAPPITYTPSAPSEASTGEITEGEHLLGYVIEHRGGFIGRPSPDSGSGTPGLSTFVPVSKTAAGSKNFAFTLNTTWPTSAVKVHVIMTPASNKSDFYFVPGATAAVTGGTTQSVTITFSIPDERLIAFATPASDNLLLYTQTTSNTGPFNPYKCVEYGDRMVYVAKIADTVSNNVSAAFVSERNAYQSIFPDLSLIQLPGQREITTAFVMVGGLYFAGPNWTHRTADTGGYPTQWPTPALVDGKIGTHSIHGVDVAASGDYAWVADKAGLYLFDGARYGSKPVSFYQSDQWERINWTYARNVQVVDDQERNRVVVFAPLDDATTPSHMLVWWYRNGKDYRSVDFTIDSISGFDMGCGAIVQNELDGSVRSAYKHQELWIAPSDADYIVRQKSENDTSKYADRTQPIAWVWKTAPLPKNSVAIMNRHHGMHLCASGTGMLGVTHYSTDGNTSTDLPIISLETSPGKEYYIPAYMVSEVSSYKFATNEADSYCILSHIKAYSSPFARIR